MKQIDASSGGLVVAAVLAFVSLGWAVWTTRTVAPQPAPALTNRSEEAAGGGAVDEETAARVWLPPRAQSHGAEWIYDVFTAPEIFYDATANRFTVTPPELARPRALPTPLAGVELVSVEREPYRLQLVGFIGREGEWRGTFEDRQTGATLLGRAGRALEDTGLELRSLDVRRVTVALPDSMSTTQRIATAIVRDVRTGEDIELNSAERRLTHVPLATIATADGERHDVHAGDDFPVGDEVFHVEAVRLEPASVEVTRVVRGKTGAPERHTLSLPAAAAATTDITSRSAAP